MWKIEQQYIQPSTGQRCVIYHYIYDPSRERGQRWNHDYTTLHANWFAWPLTRLRRSLKDESFCIVDDDYNQAIAVREGL